MQASSSISESQRECLVELFEQGLGYLTAANRLGIGRDVSRNLYKRWRLHGRLCLVKRRTYQKYSFEIKKEVVERFLAGETRMELAKEFDLSSDEQVRMWVHDWREGGDDALRPKPKGRPRGSAKPVVVTEEDKLRRELERLRAENAYLKKLRDLRNQRRG